MPIWKQPFNARIIQKEKNYRFLRSKKENKSLKFFKCVLIDSEHYKNYRRKKKIIYLSDNKKISFFFIHVILNYKVKNFLEEKIRIKI